MSTVRRPAIVFAVVLATVAFSASVPGPEGEEWERLRSMPLPQRTRLSERLKAFDRLDADTQQAVRALDRKLAAETEEDRKNDLAVLRRYHLWLSSLPESKRNALAAAPADKRLAMALRLRNEEKAEGHGETFFYQAADFGSPSPYEVAQLLKVWFSLNATQKAAVTRLPEGERRPRMMQYRIELKIPQFDRPRAQQVEQIFQRAANDKHFPFIRERAELPKVQDKERLKKRVAEHYVFIENPPKSVAPDKLLLFDRAMPSWVRSAFDALPPEEARRRLTILYRLLYPAGTEMKPLAEGGAPPEPKANAPGPAAKGRLAPTGKPAAVPIPY